MLCKANIEDIQLVCAEDHLPNCPSGWIPVPDDGGDGDLNQGVNTNFRIRLCQLPTTTGGLTEVQVLANPQPGGACVDGATKISGPGCNGDTNEQAGGLSLYVNLCELTVPPPKGDPIELIMVTGDSSDVQCPQWYNRIRILSGDGDLNQGAGGKFKYLCYTEACSFKKPFGTWVPFTTLVASTTNVKVTVGSSSTSELTETESMATLASTTIGAGFTASAGPTEISASIENTNEVSSTVAKETMQSTSMQQQTQVDMTFEGKGTLWQWQFTLPELNCPQKPGQTSGLTIDTNYLIVTPSTGQPPCCLPGFHVDGNYRHCSSKDYMLPNNVSDCTYGHSLSQGRRVGRRSNFRGARLLSVDGHDEASMLQFSQGVADLGEDDEL